MKAQWSGIGVTEGRGKLQGSVASRNRSGPYWRVKVTPVNPQTIFQQAARNELAQFSQLWKTLTQGQRDSFDNATQDFARTDVFGSLRNPTGKNLHSRLNINLSNAGQPAITSAPLPSGSGSVVAGTLLMSSALVKSIAHTLDTAGHTILVFATPGVSPGRKFVKQEFRLISTFAGGSASPTVITIPYEARFGQPAVGSRVTVRLVSINDDTGESSPGSTSTAIVTV